MARACICFANVAFSIDSVLDTSERISTILLTHEVYRSAIEDCEEIFWASAPPKKLEAPKLPIFDEFESLLNGNIERQYLRRGT